MKTVIKQQKGITIIIDWWECFDNSTGIREITCDFAGNEGEKPISGAEWVRQLYITSSKDAARLLLKTFGVKKVRSSARRFFREIL